VINTQDKRRQVSFAADEVKSTLQCVVGSHQYKTVMGKSK